MKPSEAGISNPKAIFGSTAITDYLIMKTGVYCVSERLKVVLVSQDVLSALIFVTCSYLKILKCLRKFR